MLTAAMTTPTTTTTIEAKASELLSTLFTANCFFSTMMTFLLLLNSQPAVERAGNNFLLIHLANLPTQFVHSSQNILSQNFTLSMMDMRALNKRGHWQYNCQARESELVLLRRRRPQCRLPRVIIRQRGRQAGKQQQQQAAPAIVLQKKQPTNKQTNKQINKQQQNNMCARDFRKFLFLVWKIILNTTTTTTGQLINDDTTAHF
ncbi:putative transcriptional regulator CudA [Trichinella spiralis]|uniref:putative transcriptional regulator CudA n=1 Tax=Trichinella spiralis TaxID=6334 RepID=UPI0001EFDF91|nr:putative transcriptional regulator CudA [Trichinella spiralis]